MKNALLIIVLTLSAWHQAAADFFSEPVSSNTSESYPYALTGLIQNDLATGSGATVKHPRIVISCAHVVFDEYRYRWITDNYYTAGWHQSYLPSQSGSVPLRGFYYFTSYATYLQSYGSTGSQTFSKDFVVHYAYRDTAGGQYADYFEDGVSALKTTAEKLLVGYPAALYRSGDPSEYLMHAAGPFTNQFYADYGPYLGTDGVATAGGNSGGPVFVSDSSDYRFAGVLVSGLNTRLGDSTNTIGVVGINSQMWGLVESAIADGSGSSLVVRGNGYYIPNRDKTPSLKDGTDFGSIADRRTTRSRRFYLTNSGAESLVRDGRISLAGAGAKYFSVTRQPSALIGSDQRSALVIRFNRSPVGKYSATVRIESNDPDDNPYTFKITARRR